MDKRFSMAEVCRITGLAAHTIRYYETQFPRCLTAERTAGGHRKYRQEHIDVLRRIMQLARSEGKSLREIRAALGEDGCGALRPADEVGQTLSLVLQNLQELNTRNARLDKLITLLLGEAAPPHRETLLSQIDAARQDTRATLDDSRRALLEIGMRELLESDDEPDGHEH